MLVNQYRFSGKSAAEIGLEAALQERPRLRLTRPACSEQDMTLWTIPAAPASFQKALKQNREALNICRGCRDRLPCLQWALDQGEPAGIWGGILESERIDAIDHGVTALELIIGDSDRAKEIPEPGWRERERVAKARKRRAARTANSPG